MAELIFVLLCLGVVTALAMRQAPMWLWALAAVAATFLWQAGVVDGSYGGLHLGFWSLVGWVPALIAVLLAIPSLRRSLLVDPVASSRYRAVRSLTSAEVASRAARVVGTIGRVHAGAPSEA